MILSYLFRSETLNAELVCDYVCDFKYRVNVIISKKASKLFHDITWIVLFSRSYVNPLATVSLALSPLYTPLTLPLKLTEKEV